MKKNTSDFNAEYEGLHHQNAYTSTRKGWNEAFQCLHKNNDDHLLMDDVFDDEHFEEWEERN